MISKVSKKIVNVVEKWATFVRTEDKKFSGNDAFWRDPLEQLIILPDTTRKAILEKVSKEERDYYDFSTRIVGFENILNECTVTLLFDGTAWNYLSYESEFRTYRDQLEAALEKKGFYMEDATPCAISIQKM